MAMREKYILSQELKNKDAEIIGDKRLSLLGPSSAMGALLPNGAVIRQAMHIKHEEQRLTINDPEFPFVFTGAENIIGENSSFYSKADRDFKVYAIVKKYEGLLKGKCNMALYFLYDKNTDYYTVVERQEVENLTEKFGFKYNNDYLDNLEIGDEIKNGTVLYSTTSYDEYMNTRNGVNARMLFAVDPHVTEDANIISESFAKKVVTNKVTTISIPLNENAILLNLYGDENNYKGIPDIGERIHGNILAATRQIQGNRLFSDLRDNSLGNANFSSDQVYYGDGEVIDIDIYCNNRDIKSNFVNAQIIRYLNDEKAFYRKVYRTCKAIMNSGSDNIDIDVKRWMRKAINFIDDDAKWAYNDNTFSNMMIDILIRKEEPITVGRKIAGRYGNKNVVSTIWADEDMPFTSEQIVVDEFGVKHPVGELRHVDIITNPLAIINRTIAASLLENSMTFVIDKVRHRLSELTSIDKQEELFFDVLKIFNPKQAKSILKEYSKLGSRAQEKFFESVINEGMYIQQQPFDEDGIIVRDSLVELYDKYPDILDPFHVFIPKRKWGRDIHVGQFHIGYQYMLMLKQDGEKGFSTRSAGSISDESLPEKSNENKIAKLWHSETPIRFGEYETPNFMVINKPEDFAIITALYRSSIDGRRFMYEAILAEDDYDIPDKFTSRTAEILEVYLKSLGVRMRVLNDDDMEFIGEEDDNDIMAHTIKNRIIFATPKEMYYINKMSKAYNKLLKKHENQILDDDGLWEELMNNLPFKKKHLTEDIINIFRRNYEVLSS